MYRIVLLIVVTLLPCVAMAAERPREPQRPPATAPRPAESNPCAIYGAGFVRVEGTSTCVKVGGHLTIDVGNEPLR